MSTAPLERIPDPRTKPYLTPSELAVLLHEPKSTVYARLANGTYPSQRLSANRLAIPTQALLDQFGIRS